jgi:hypothetical protein
MQGQKKHDTARKTFPTALPESFTQMATSKSILKLAIQGKLGMDPTKASPHPIQS